MDVRGLHGANGSRSPRHPETSDPVPTVRGMDAAARARIEGWKLSLLEARRPAEERLRNVGDTGVPLAGDPVRIAAALAEGATLRVGSAELAANLAGDELARALTLVRRDAQL